MPILDILEKTVLLWFTTEYILMYGQLFASTFSKGTSPFSI